MKFTKLNLPSFKPKTIEKGEKLYIYDLLRKKYVRLFPEEWVRQHLINLFINYLGYPRGLIRLEGTIKHGVVSSSWKRTDLIIFNPKNGTPSMVVECKSAVKSLNYQAISQLSEYNRYIKAPLLLLTNGIQYICYRVNFVDKTYKILEKIPSFNELNAY